jgi:type IV secretion system protein VirD4
MNQNLQKKPGYLGAFDWRASATVLSSVSGSNWAATQYLAHQFQQDPELGSPLLHLFHYNVYEPLSWLPWIWQLRIIDDPTVRMPLIYSLGIVLGGSLAGTAIARFLRGRRMKRLNEGADELHGSARWAEKKDLVKAGLLGKKKGNLIGAWYDQEEGILKYLRHKGPHFLLEAGSRKGKGVSLVIPNVLEWQDNMLINDPKGELWTLTAGYRTQELNQKCVKFSPTEEDSDSYNFLEEVRLRTFRETSDAQNIAGMLIRTTEENGNNKHWFDVSESFAIGLILHKLYEHELEGKPSANLADIYEALTPYGLTLREWLMIMCNYEHDPKDERGWKLPDGTPTRTHPVIRKKFEEMLARNDEEFSNVVSSLTTAFLVFSDPLVAKATARSCFQATDLVAQDPISVYMIVPFSDKKRLNPLIRLLVSQVISKNTEKMDHQMIFHRSQRRKCQLLMDEFRSLGYMDVWADALTQIAGYQMQAFLIVHSAGQIEEVFGKDNSLMNSIDVRMAFTPNERKSAEALSEHIGETTVARVSSSFSGKQGQLYGPQNASAQIDYTKRPLLDPNEVMKMKSLRVDEENGQLIPGDMLIFVNGEHPIYGTQALYMADPELLRRTQIEPPKPTTIKPEDEEEDNRLRERQRAVLAS